MSRWGVLSVFVLMAAAIAGAQQLPPCTDSDCQTLARLIADAPNGFRSSHGTPMNANYWNCNPMPPGMSYCQVQDTVIAVQDTGSQEAGHALFHRLEAALKRVAPSWCGRHGTNGGGPPYYFMLEPDCDSNREPVELSDNNRGGVQLTIVARKMGNADIAREHAVGTFRLTGMPENAIAWLRVHMASYVEDVRETSGKADSTGLLEIRNIHPGKYTLHITSFGHKPYDHPQDVVFTGDDTQSPAVKLEPGPLGLAEVVEALQKNVLPARIKKFVMELGVDFPLTDATEKQLRDAGADDSLLVVIAKNKK